FRALVLRGLGILFGRRFLLGGLFLRHSGLFRFFGFFGLCFLFGRLGICGLLGLLFLGLLLCCLALVGLAHCWRRGRCRGGRCRRGGGGWRRCSSRGSRFRRLRFGRRRGGRARCARNGNLILDLSELAFLDALDLHDVRRRLERAVGVAVIDIGLGLC